MAGARRRSIYISRRTGERKVRTDVMIPEDLYINALKAAIDVYGRRRGAFSLAVQEALEAWLAARAGARRRPNPRAPIREVYNRVLDVIQETWGEVPITFPQRNLEDAIADALNIKDRRSILGWIHRFYVAGLIKPLTVDVKEESDWRRNKAVEFVARRA